MHAVPPVAPQPFSQWLDLFRWTAAWIVLVSHVGGVLLIPLSRLPEAYHSLPQMAYSFVAGLSHYAVMIFFVMSGYLVGGRYVGNGSGAQDIRDYLTKRITRLSIVLIPTLIITAFLAAGVSGIWGQAAIQGFGADDGLLKPEAFICNALFMQDILCRQYGSNASLWSLTHEFWYYVAFPLVMAPVLTARGPVSLISALVGLAILAALTAYQFHPVSIGLYFVIWILGVVVAIVKPIFNFRKSLSITFLGVFLVSTALLRILRTEMDGGQFAGFLTDFLVATMFSILLVVMKFDRDLTNPIFPKLHHHLAKFSFSLYCIHFPVVLSFSAFGVYVLGIPTVPAVVDIYRWIYVFMGILICVTAAYGLYMLTERHTDTFRNFLFKERGI